MTSSSSRLPLVVIGASTGGPNALAEILSCLPKTFKAVVVIIQHVDKEFSAGLAEWLDRRTPLKVILAPEGCRPEPGMVYVAGTNDHLIFKPDFTFSYISQLVNIPYHPSVDIFFKSIISCRFSNLTWGRKYSGGTAVLLTGMGRDGAEGLLSLRKAGWHTIAQDQTTSVVYGMPRAAREIDAAMEILPLMEIAPAILKMFG